MFLHRLREITLKKRDLVFRVGAILLPLIFTVLLLSQTVFAKTTYVITDGNRVLVHTTSATDPKAVLAEAGLTLGADDTYTTTTQEGDGSAAINVCRNKTVSIDYYGEHMEAESYGETVEELLNRLNLSWNQTDIVSQSLDAEVYDGMELRIAGVVKENQTYTKALAHETVYCQDATLPAGTQRVLTEGVDGQVVCDVVVTYINGEESQRTLIEERVMTQPVDEVVALGCGADTAELSESDQAVIGDGIITLPTGEVLTYSKVMEFCATAYTHTDPGCDMITATGTTVHWGTVAVDPKVIPYGTRMFIVNADGSFVYGVATAEDCGGAIKGRRLDLYMPTYRQCINFGRQQCQVYFLG